MYSSDPNPKLLSADISNLCKVILALVPPNTDIRPQPLAPLSPIYLVTSHGIVVNSIRVTANLLGTSQVPNIAAGSTVLNKVACCLCRREISKSSLAKDICLDSCSWPLPPASANRKRLEVDQDEGGVCGGCQPMAHVYGLCTMLQ